MRMICDGCRQTRDVKVKIEGEPCDCGAGLWQPHPALSVDQAGELFGDALVALPHSDRADALVALFQYLEQFLPSVTTENIAAEVQQALSGRLHVGAW